MGIAAALGLLAGILGLAFWLSTSETRRRNETLRLLGERVGGRLIRMGPRARAHLELEVDRFHGVLIADPGDGDGPGHTRFRFSWIPPGGLRLTPESLLDRVGAWFGRADWQVGDRDFDRRFRIVGHPEDWLRDALDPRARKLIVLLAELGDGLQIDLGPSGVMVEVARDLVPTPGTLELALEHVIELIRRWRTAAEGRGALLSAAQMVADGRCPVCAESVGGNPRDCPRCGARHHAECWNYFGGCAIFGCDWRQAAALPGGKSGK